MADYLRFGIEVRRAAKAGKFTSKRRKQQSRITAALLF
jgi:hypothetical protein